MFTSKLFVGHGSHAENQIKVVRCTYNSNCKYPCTLQVLIKFVMKGSIGVGLRFISRQKELPTIRPEYMVPLSR